jgi:hypothetical protein
MGALMQHSQAVLCPGKTFVKLWKKLYYDFFALLDLETNYRLVFESHHLYC